MARNFVRASSQDISVGSLAALAVGTGDFSIAATIYAYTIDVGPSSTCPIFSLTGGVLFELGIFQSKVDFICSTQIVPASTISINTLYKFLVKRESGTITVFLNGSSIASAANTQSLSTPTGIHIGRRDGTSFYFDGQISELALWSAALSAGEINSHAQGFTPSSLKPQSLIFYAPLVRDLIDFKGNSLTNNSTTVIEHPRVIY